MMRFWITFLLFLSIASSLRAQEFSGQAESIGTINSQFDENFLYVFPDEQKMVFTRSKHPRNFGGNLDAGDMWMSSKEDQWTSPILMKVDNYDGLQTPLGSYNNLFLWNNVLKEFGASNGNIKEGRIEQHVLSRNLTLDIPYFNSTSPVQSGFVSRDGKYIIFSMESRVTYGVEDLYVSIKKNGSWTAPKNLGSTINSPFQEYTPFLSDDGYRLFWSSNGRSGPGSFDVYVSGRIDDTWQNWSLPVDLGPVINTEGAETSFQILDEYAYFVSTTDSDGYGDIKRIKLVKSEILDTTSIANNLEPEDIYLARFYIMNGETKRLVPSNLEVERFSGTQEFKNDGFVDFPFNAEEDVRVRVSAEGYFPTELLLSLSQETSDSITLFLEPLITGRTITLENVLFLQGTSTFVPGSEAELNRVVNMMKENPEVNIFLSGHTDNRGRSHLNQELSQERVDAVKEFLVNAGIEASRIDGKGYGGSKPIFDNANNQARKFNRRVEFTILREDQ